MSEETFPIEFFGGSRDGDVLQATSAPDHHVVVTNPDIKELYERQNEEPPFHYVHVGYVQNETWT